MMKVAICAKNDLGLSSEVDDRFGRAEFYVIFDTEKAETIVLENSAKNEAAGAGGKAVSLLHKQGVDTLVVPELGPKALKAANAFELTAYQIDDSKTAQEVLNALLAGKLTKLEIASVESHNGLRKV
jgi:predicted Fe-Mo cluster-binding NifX family protein